MPGFEKPQELLWKFFHNILGMNPLFRKTSLFFYSEFQKSTPSWVFRSGVEFFMVKRLDGIMAETMSIGIVGCVYSFSVFIIVKCHNMNKTHIYKWFSFIPICV